MERTLIVIHEMKKRAETEDIKLISSILLKEIKKVIEWDLPRLQ